MSKAIPWYEGFFDGLYGRVLAGQFDDARTMEQARTVRRLLHLRRGRRVLDVPCGQGRLTIPLARWGLAMTGVDRTASYVRKARRRARREGLAVRFVQADMREIDFDGEFDAVFNWFGSFGYFSRAGNLAFCRRLLRALRPGGRLLIEGINKSWLVAHFDSGGGQTIAGVRIDHRARWDGRCSRVRDTWTLTRGRRTERHTISIQVYSGAEMRRLLRAAGFVDIRLFAREPGKPFTRHSRRLIAVARRPRQASS